MSRLLKSLAVGSVLAFLVLFGTSCSGLFSDFDDDSGDGTTATGSLVLQLGANISPMTIEPRISMEVAAYRLWGEGPGSLAFFVEEHSGDSYTRDGLAAGDWVLTVEAMNESGTPICSCTDTVSIIAGQTASKSMVAVPLTGDGTLVVDLSWPDVELSAPAINAVLEDDDNNAIDLSFTVGAEAAHLETTLPAGYYGLTLGLVNESEELWGTYEAVRILARHESSKFYSFTAGTLSLSVDSEPDNPIGITFSGQVNELPVGGSMTVSATLIPDVTPDSYQWYLDGTAIAGATEPAITIGSTLSGGFHRLDLAVRYAATISAEGFTFKVVDDGIVIRKLVAGSLHTLAIADDDTLWAWGNNPSGQLGDGTTVNRLSPVQVMTDVSTVAAGGTHSLALKNDGTLWAWGNNNNGQLGDNTTTDRLSPVQVPLMGVVALEAGTSSSYAVKNDGTVWAWGDNYYGQLGVGLSRSELEESALPREVGISRVVALSAGIRHCLALDADGTLWGWGNNDFGQIGFGDNVARFDPTELMTDIVSFSAGSMFSVVAKSDGTAWAFGYNYSGQLGDGSTTNRHEPVQVWGLTAVTDVIAGGDFVHAIRSDGTFWGWGGNGTGQLGNGDTTNRYTPTEIALTDISVIVSGNTYSIARQTDGSYWAWGYNGTGQLGDGTSVGKALPVQIPF